MLFVAVLGTLVSVAGTASAAGHSRPVSSSGITIVSVLETRVGVARLPAPVFVGSGRTVVAGHVGRTCPMFDASTAGSCVATKPGTGGVGPVRVGQAGEAAVRGAYDIGPKATVNVGGRTRILDGLTDEAVSEVKNVASQSFTQQLKDSLAYAQSTGRRFDLYVRPSTTLSGPLEDAVRSGLISIRYIP